MGKNLNEGRVDGPFLFIVNERAGTGAHQHIERLIAECQSTREVVIIKSANAAESIALAKEAQTKGFAAVVAAGGDGTVHTIGSALTGSSTALGILPIGSGNGIARHLGISMNLKTATEQLLHGNYRLMDTMLVNSEIAIGFAGVGFDGKVAHSFSNSRNRGFINYIRLTVKALSKNNTYAFQLDQQQRIHAAAVIVANVSQLGNNAYINPTAQDDDGFFEQIKIREIPLLALPALVTKLFSKQFHTSKFVVVDRKQSTVIVNLDKAPAHIDGEPFGFPDTIIVQINPRSLKVIVP